MTSILLLLIKRVIFSALAVSMSLVLPIRALAFKRQHWFMYIVSILTCICFVYLAASQFIKISNQWVMPIVVSEIVMDIILSWWIIRPTMHQLQAMHKELPPAKLAAEKVSLVLGCFAAMIILSVGFAVGLLYH